MDLAHIEYFLLLCKEMHFGRTAKKLNIAPASLSRHIRMLEQSFNVRLFMRTTRNIVLTKEGEYLFKHGPELLTLAQTITQNIALMEKTEKNELQIGAMDSAASGLLPMLMRDFYQENQNIKLFMHEDKTINLIPKILTGRLDIAFIRPPEQKNPLLQIINLFDEHMVIALPSSHPLATAEKITIDDLKDQPMILPERRYRPHSHDLVINIFKSKGYDINIAQMASEKNTIINLVAMNIGLAIVPLWTTKLTQQGVSFVELQLTDNANLMRLPLAVAFLKNTRDAAREKLFEILQKNIKNYADEL